MSFSSPLKDISTSEKLQMMESLWEDLTRRAVDYSSPAWHGEVLASREQDAQTGDAQFEDWRQAKESIQKQLS